VDKMAKDNDEFVRSTSFSHSLPSPEPDDHHEPGDTPPSEEDVAAFDRVFAQFDPNNTGVVSMRDFLSIIDELDALRPRSAKPLLSEVQREQSQAFTSSEGGTAEMTRDQLFEFIKEMTGNQIIIASPKKKSTERSTVRNEEESPTKSDVGKRGLLPGISARGQVRPPHRRRRGDMEKMADDGTTNLIAEDENFSAVLSFWIKVDFRFLLHRIFRKGFLRSTFQDGMLRHPLLHLHLCLLLDAPPPQWKGRTKDTERVL
jgi:hypothetical protein